MPTYNSNESVPFWFSEDLYNLLAFILENITVIFKSALGYEIEWQEQQKPKHPNTSKVGP